jgi:hypothetical protein
LFKEQDNVNQLTEMLASQAESNYFPLNNDVAYRVFRQQQI